MELWKIHHHSFARGEQRVLDRLNGIQETYHAIMMGKLKEPNEYFADVHQQMFDDVSVEKPLSADEIERRKMEHNKKVFNNLKHGQR